MMRHNGQKGFSLVTAIFLLVVLAVLMVFMINLRSVQQSTVVMSLQGARAMQAARAGLEYAVFNALNASTCAAETLTFDAVEEPALANFTVSLNCTPSSHTEGPKTIVVYRITALAEFGSLAMGGDANPDYVSRRLSVTVSDQPY